jgi:hypothetical protein
MWQVGVVAVASRAKGIAGSVGRLLYGCPTNVTRDDLWRRAPESSVRVVLWRVRGSLWLLAQFPAPLEGLRPSGPDAYFFLAVAHSC